MNTSNWHNHKNNHKTTEWFGEQNKVDE